MKMFLIIILLGIITTSNAILLRTNPFGQNPSFISRNSPMPQVKVSTNSFIQRVDHYSSQNSDTFNQTYLRIEDYYKPGGPIFIVIGGQSLIIDYLLPYYHIHDIAKELNGLLFQLEHRYYGSSIPFEILTTENLKYLTIDQALADIAFFIDHVKSKYVPSYTNSSDVYLIGNQYSGGLAVWFRQKYSHLVAGAWASSATVMAKVDNYKYNEMVGEVYQKIGRSKCYNLLEKGFSQMDEMIANGETAELSKIFGLCNDIGIDKRDTWMYMSYISQIFGNIINSPVYGHTVLSTCNFLLNQSFVVSEMESIANFHLSLLDDNNTCYTVNLQEVLDVYSDTDPNSITIQLGIRQFVYQECSTLGWFPSSSSKYQPFGTNVDVRVFYEICKGVFGSGFDEETIHKNAEFFNIFNGGLNPQVTNVIFTHGELDPFRSLGVLRQLNDEIYLIFIPGFASSSDIEIINELNPPELIKAKKKIQEIFTNWIANT